MERMNQLEYRVVGELSRINGTGHNHLLSRRQAARELGGARRELDAAISRGQVRCVKVGQRLKIKRGELERWIESLQRPFSHR
jgi:excisionase family DNA binding protein